MNVDLSKLITAEAKTATAEAAAQAAAEASARAYLAETDWYVTRKIDTGAAIPPDITAARDAARAELNTKGD